MTFAENRELNLAGNQITTLPRQFCTGALATSLRQLVLSNNVIELLPNFTCSLASLLHLNLARNKLRALPPAFARLSQLKHLDASHNLLSVVPGGLARLRLDCLELTGNNFSLQEPRVLRDRWSLFTICHHTGRLCCQVGGGAFSSRNLCQISSYIGDPHPSRRGSGRMPDFGSLFTCAETDP